MNHSEFLSEDNWSQEAKSVALPPIAPSAPPPPFNPDLQQHSRQPYQEKPRQYEQQPPPPFNSQMQQQASFYQQPPPQAPTAPPQYNSNQLPEGWIQAVQPDGRISYQNTITRETSWTLPPPPPYGQQQQFQRQQSSTTTTTTYYQHPQAPQLSQGGIVYVQQAPPQQPQQLQVIVTNSTTVQHRGVNHACHCCLFLFTGGLWLPIWCCACCGCCCERPCE